MITIRSLTLGSLLLTLAGCGSNGAPNQSSTSPNSTSSSTEMGCAVAPACGSCEGCYQTCICVSQVNGATLDSVIPPCISACKGAGSSGPSGTPTSSPTSSPTGAPTGSPTGLPTGSPTGFPTGTPTGTPTSTATGTPTSTATGTPTSTATGTPTSTATGTPTPAGTTATLTMSSFDLAPGGEAFKCQSFKNANNGIDKAITQSESFMTPGSHHMFAFLTTNADAPLADCSGLEFKDFIHSAQTPQQTNQYPAGMGRLWQGGYGVQILAHYLNTTSSSLHAAVSINFDLVDTNQVQTYVAGIFLNNATLSVPPGTSTASHTYTLGQTINLMSGVSHMHKQGVSFLAKTSDGRVLYQGTDWNEPQSTVFNPAMVINAGTTISWACTYNNTTGRTLTFGESASANEMCIFSGMFYPAPGGGGISSLL